MRKLLSFFIILCTTVISANATWNRVISVEEITSGGTFIIGYEATANSGVLVPMRAELNSGNYMNSGTTAGSSEKTTIDMNSIAETTDYEIQITPSSVVNGAVNLMVGASYIGNENAKNSCKLYDSEAATTAFTPTIGSNDVVTFTIKANATYKTLQYNTSSPRFAVYGGTQKNLVLYKLGGEISVTGITLSSETATISINKTITLTATIEPANATNTAITWESDRPDIATVTDGVVTGISEGTAIITATTEDGNKTATCTVIVTAPLPSTTYELVTDGNALQAGDKILIVAADYAFALGSTQNSNNRSQTAIVKDGNTISISNEDVAVITLEGEKDNWTLHVTNGYLYAVSGSNYLRTIEEGNAASYWTITISAGATTIKNNSTTTDYYIMYNNTSGIFSSYKNTQKAVQIYKEKQLETGLQTPTTLTRNTIFTAAGTLHVNTEIGSQIEVYNILGQKLISTTAQSNETKISGLKTGQILIVKANQKVVKVKL